MPKQIEFDGAIQEFPDDFTDAEIQQALAKLPQPAVPNAFPTQTAAAVAARSMPAALRTGGAWAAEHPVATQRIIGVGTQAALGGLGYHEIGPVGGLIGASIRGLTPRQQDITRVGLQLAGKTPAVAEHAANATGLINYAAEQGTKVLPSDVINKPAVGEAIQNYAAKQGKGVMELFDEFGRPMAGPKAPGRIPTVTPSSTLSKVGQFATKVLNPLSGALAVGDLAQAAEPNRKDIGTLGIGAAQPDPTPDELAKVNARNVANVQAQAQQQAALRQRILAMLGIH